MALQNVKSPRGPVVPIVEIVRETGRLAPTVRDVITDSKIPIISVKAKRRDGSHRRVMCVEPKYVATILMKLAKRRRNQRKSDQRNGGEHATAPTEQTAAPGVKPVTIASLDRSYLLDLFRTLEEHGLQKLHFEGNKLSYSTKPVEEEIEIR
jgi:hypothetical protein